jgi:uncharacterized protein
MEVGPAPLTPTEKFAKLVQWFKGLRGVVVAYSGGVDSTVVSLAAVKALGGRAVAVTQVSATLGEDELREAIEVAREIGIRHVLVGSRDDLDPLVAANTPARCYFCRSNLADVLLEIARKEDIDTIVDGTNMDDLGDTRPGILAMRSAGVRSPLVELGLGKREVREMARALKLPNAEKPANACLASRIPHWTPIDHDLLKMVDEAERIVRRMVGATQVRVRVHGALARIEVAPEERSLFFSEDTMSRVSEALNRLGFTFVALDLAGYRQGSVAVPVHRGLKVGPAPPEVRKKEY